jgi:alanine racemase
VNPSNESTDPLRARLVVDLSALRQNAATIRDISGSRLLPMVKANGYGLGAIAVARGLEPLEPWGFGVATAEEGAELRAAGIARPIVAFTPLPPSRHETLLRSDLRPAIGDLAALRAWTARGPAPFHLEIDTGMSRNGFRWDDVAGIRAAAELAGTAPGWEGVFTHFHSADSDIAATRQQWERFQDVLRALPRRPELVHAANSAAALRGREFAAGMVRPGIFLYGGTAGTPLPRPVATLRAPVVAVRTVQPGDSVSYDAEWRARSPTLVATIGAGYADGVPRSLGNRGIVEVNGVRLPIAGRVTMDMTMVAAEPGIEVGQEAILWGGAISLDQQAALAGTISYELLTSLQRRVARVYLEHA